jgi:hypothetical protein
MSNDESNQRLAQTPPNSDERKERMKQLANVAIEMFLALRHAESNTPTELVEAA